MATFDPARLAAIRRSFDDQFARWSIVLPERLSLNEVRTLAGQGWTITYRLGLEQGQLYLDYFASHRMTNDTLSRIAEDGSHELLGYCQEFYLADNPEAEQAYYAHNRAFYDDVKRRGLG
jgi:hypothetical protein